MCGILGWINLEENIKEKERLLNNMTLKLFPRGPDANGIWVSEHALIGHTRLIVVDPIGGKQPMTKTTEAGTFVITYNGELYNTKELRKELTDLGHSIKTNSDTEILLESYIRWGYSCVDHLNGIYAFGIFNEKNQTLFLARDRFGVKPLFYTVKNNNLIFGSELKSILAHPD